MCGGGGGVWGDDGGEGGGVQFQAEERYWTVTGRKLDRMKMRWSRWLPDSCLDKDLKYKCKWKVTSDF